MAAISVVFVLMEHGTPLFLGLQIDEVFRVEEAGRIGAVIGPSHLADHLRSLRGTWRAMTRAWFMMRMPSVGPVLGASVPRAQIAPSSRCGRNSDPIVRLNTKVPAR